MRVRPKGAELPVPAVVHLRLGHFSALVEHRGSRYLLRDPAFGGPVWMTPEALDEELSGFVLVPRGARTAWASVSPAEAETVVGHSCLPGGWGNDDPPYCPFTPRGRAGGGGRSSAGGGCSAGPSCGLVTHAFAPHNASLQLTDTPAGYAPARGPAVSFTTRYDYRQAIQPQVFTYANLGPRWTFEWVGFAKEEPLGYSLISNEYLPEHVWVYLRGGGREVFPGPPDGTGTFPASSSARIFPSAENTADFPLKACNTRFPCKSTRRTAPAFSIARVPPGEKVARSPSHCFKRLPSSVR